MGFFGDVGCKVGIHDWSDWFYENVSNCRQVRKCNRCGKLNAEKRTEHSFGVWSYPTEGSCLRVLVATSALVPDAPMLRKKSSIRKVPGRMTEKVTVLSIELVRAAPMLKTEKNIPGIAGITRVPRAVISCVFARFATNARPVLSQKMKIMSDGVSGIMRVSIIAVCSSGTV
jgi:hypothetical protein